MESLKSWFSRLDGFGMFDQLLVSRGLLTGKSGIKISTESAEVVRDPSMLNRNCTLRRFGRPSSGLDTTGASDHLPVGGGFAFTALAILR